LFGAGASYGSVDCTPYEPPLGKDLFPHLLKESEIVGTWDEELRQYFERDFETGMKKYIETQEVEIPTLLREMSKYFIQFTPGPTNLYRRLVTSLAQRQKKLGEHLRQRIVLATLNYDLLLERAIHDAGCALAYPTYGTDAGLTYCLPPAHPSRQHVLNNYWAKYNVNPIIRTSAFEILKVHGSCNFLPDARPEQIRGLSIVGVANTEGSGASAIESRITPEMSTRLVLDYIRRAQSLQSPLAPAISMYAKGKQVLVGARYIREQQARFQATVAEADKIFLVGAKVWPEDTHIWDHIAASKAWLGYVGGREPRDFLDWCQETKHSDHQVLGTSFEDAFPAIEQEIHDVKC
jgi:hypothetical protein